MTRVDVRHMKHIVESTAKHIIKCEMLWMVYFEYVLGSAEAAIATLTPGAELPAMKELKEFVRLSAVTGISRLKPGTLGWSKRTTERFCACIHALVSQTQLSDNL